MRTLTGCPLCEHRSPGGLRELHRLEGDPYGLASLKGQPAIYVICMVCGFVFQNPTLDEDELSTLYQGEYRTYDPPADYLKDQKILARRLCDWLEPRLPKPFPVRRVLDIGCGAGCFLSEFAREGWDTVGVDGSAWWTAWGKEHFGLDLRAGLFGADGIPGEQFSLVIFSHVIEHLPDPLPVLRAIRRSLRPDGVLFVGAPNILLPPTNTLFKGNFFAGPHVCLYSPRSMQRVLAKAGFRVLVQDNWIPRGLRVLAVPSETPYRPGEYANDDWRVIDHLYGGLVPGCYAGKFAHNLAGLLPRYWMLLEELAKPRPGLSARMHKKDGQIVNLRISTPSGDLPLLVEAEGSAQGSQDVDVPDRGLLVLVGLGFGQYALSLLPHLEHRKAKLVIWERDYSVLRTALAVNDLRPLLQSPRVRLCGGSHAKLTSGTKRWFQTATRVVWRTDPQLHPDVRDVIYAPAERDMQAWAHQFVNGAASSVKEPQPV